MSGVGGASAGPGPVEAESDGGCPVTELGVEGESVARFAAPWVGGGGAEL